MRGPLPPGGSAKILKAPQPGQVGRSAWPIHKFCRNSKMSSIQNRRSAARPVPLAIRIQLRRGILCALAKPKGNGTLCEKPAAAALAYNSENRDSRAPILCAALFEW